MNFGDESLPRRGRGAAAAGTRRSTRTTVVNNNGKREGSSDSALWRGERRSTRLGGLDTSRDIEPPRKRARTEDSMDMDSIHSNDTAAADKTGVANGVRVKTSGAAALKPTEIALEQIAGKKRSKFWVYAVEPVATAEPTPSDVLAGPPAPSPHQTGTKTDDKHTNGTSTPISNGQSHGGTGHSADTVSSSKLSS